jgi:glycosyltransferase involved in cell wall biosynthesis
MRPANGIGRCVETLVSDRTEIEHQIFCLKPQRQEWINRFKTLIIKKISTKEKKSFSEAVIIALKIRSEKYDIIVFHTKSAFKIAVLLKILGSKTIRVQHTSKGIKPRPWLLRKLIGIFSLVYDKWVAPSNSVKVFLQNRWGVSEKRIDIIYNGVDTEQFMPVNRIKNEKNVMLLSIGTLNRVKNHQFLIDIMSLIIENNPKTKIFLDIIGEGNERKTLKERITEKKLESCISLLKACNNIHEVIPKYDIYLHSSLSEGFGLVIAEAMACGLPVIALDVPGVRDIVSDTESGYLIEQNNKRLFASFVLKLVENENLRISLGKKGRTITLAYFSIAKMLNNYKKSYTELLNKR